jgi:hypothetical protein
VNLQRVLVASVLTVGVLVAACSSSAPDASSPATASASPPARLTQTSDGGQVTVVVDWAGPTAGATFLLTLDTHVVDLDPLDLTDAILRNDRGETLEARPWAAPKGGHHRQGILGFDGDFARLLADAEWIELVFNGIGDIPERTLRWELGS